MLERIVIALKGACMGFADAIPGVSGGTMALILGVYERFINAISVVLGPALMVSIFEATFWKELFRGLVPGQEADRSTRAGDTAWHTAFLVNLGVGVLMGLVLGVLILPVAMDTYPEAMRAFFLGLVAASVIVPWSRVGERSTATVGALAITVVLTFLLMGLRTDTSNFAQTTVVLTADAPLTSDVSFAPEAIRFATDTGQEKLRREIGFHPAAPLSLKQGESRWELPVIASQSGTKANLDGGALKQVTDSSAKKHVRLAGFTLEQPEAATGGSDPALWYVFVCGAVAICAMVLPGVSGSFLLLMLGLYGYILHTVRALLHLDFGTLPVVAVFLIGIILGLTFFSRVLRWALKRHHDLIMAVLAGLMVGSLRALWPFRTGIGHMSENVMPAGFDSTVGLVLGAVVVGVAIVLTLHRVDGSRAT